VYLRLGRTATEVVYDDDQEFFLGQATLTRDYGRAAAIIACGPSVANAVQAAGYLRDKGIGVRVIDAHSVKPLDEATILAAARECGAVVTVEDGSIHGGLGGAVAEVLAEQGDRPVPFRRLGLRSYGTAGELDDLCAFFGLDARSIALAVETLLS
ncbi:MAG: hypothetical protein LIP77_00985, partial [Planctomycetes bacterium]|nr:hypothetical protein [Planctomycetota bacterium]